MESVLVDRSPLSLRKIAAISHPWSHSSLPCAPPHARQPPLLPLPWRNPVAVPSPSNRPREHQQNKRKPRCQSVTPTKDPKAKVIAVAPRGLLRGQVDVEADDEDESRCMDFVESVYSKSPPPSSLPLPRFSLTKPKSEASADAGRAEVKGCGDDSGGDDVDAGATDGLRRLLGL